MDWTVDTMRSKERRRAEARRPRAIIAHSILLKQKVEEAAAGAEAGVWRRPDQPSVVGRILPFNFRGKGKCSAESFLFDSCIHFGHFCVPDFGYFVYLQNILFHDLVLFLPVADCHPYLDKYVSNTCFKIPECMSR